MKTTDHESNTTYTDLSRDAVKDASDISKPWDAERADKENPTKNNALKHGCYSKDIVLPWENADEFNDQFSNTATNSIRKALSRKVSWRRSQSCSG